MVDQFRVIFVSAILETGTAQSIAIPGGSFLRQIGEVQLQPGDQLLMEALPAPAFGGAALFWQLEMDVHLAMTVPIAVVRDGKVLFQAEARNFTASTVAKRLQEKIK